MNVTIAKHFTSGCLRGITNYETMKFADWNYATHWAKEMNTKKNLGWVVLTVTHSDGSILTLKEAHDVYTSN